MPPKGRPGGNFKGKHGGITGGKRKATTGNANDKEVWICKGCNAPYEETDDTTDETLWLGCAICSDVYCNRCIKIETEEWNVLNDRKDTQWFCPVCNPQYFPDPNGPMILRTTNKNMEDDIRQLTKQMEEQRKAIAELSKIVGNNNISDQLKLLEKKVEEKFDLMENEVPTKLQEKLESSQTWAQIVQSNTTSTNNISIETFKKAVSEVTEKDNEMNMRDRGLVIYRIPERSEKSIEQRKKEDEAFIHEMLHCMGLRDLIPLITHLERLGRYDEGKCKEKKFRPIKLRFTLKDIRDRVLKNLSRLRDAPEEIKRVSVRHDLSETQRQDWYAKIKQANEMSRNSTTTYYRVRGTPGNYKIEGGPKAPQAAGSRDGNQATGTGLGNLSGGNSSDYPDTEEGASKPKEGSSEDGRGRRNSDDGRQSNTIQTAC